MSTESRLHRIWYDNGAGKLPLIPLSWLFRFIVSMRRWAFRLGWLRSTAIPCPVIVVGNITVGGTGKTPFVIWLARTMAAEGKKVAVITRGYGGTATHWPQDVHENSAAQMLGDEAVLIAQQSETIVVAGPDRVAAARRAIARGAEVIISDDGLQHYRLRRDLEFAVIDNSRLLGNGWLLPAGPLREPKSRLREVALVLLNRRSELQAGALDVATVEYRVKLTQMHALLSVQSRSLDDFSGKQVHVVTGIGNPQAFLQALRQRGLRVNARILTDHAHFTRDDIEFGDLLPVLMTEKDAVKCRGFADARHWSVGAEVAMTAEAAARVLDCVHQAIARHTAS